MNFAQQVISLYKENIQEELEYGNILFAGTYQKELDKIDKVEIEAMKIVTGAISRTNIALLKLECKWEEITVRRNNAVLIMFYKMVNSDAPVGLTNILSRVTQGNTNAPIQYNLRNKKLRAPLCKTRKMKNTFFPFGINLWNELSDELKLKNHYQALNII